MGEQPEPAHTPPPQPAVIRLETEDHPLKGRLKPGWSNTLWQRRTGLWLYEWADRYHTTGARIRELKQEYDLKPPYTQAQIEAHPKMFRRYLQHQHTGMIPRQEVA